MLENLWGARKRRGRLSTSQYTKPLLNVFFKNSSRIKTAQIFHQLKERSDTAILGIKGLGDFSLSICYSLFLYQTAMFL